MGATGGSKYASKDIGKITHFTDNVNSTIKWFKNEKLSNFTEWADNLTDDEKAALDHYTGSGYYSMNDALYGTDWDDMSASQKKELSDLYNGLSKFELKKAIEVVRKCDFKLLGKKSGSMTEQQLKDAIVKNGGIIQNDGFLSAAASNSTTYGANSGLVIHITVPPSKGAGAFVAPISWAGTGEKEFLFNNNALLKFDPKSVKSVSDGFGASHLEVNAQWVGRATKQSFSKSKGKKKKN